MTKLLPRLDRSAAHDAAYAALKRGEDVGLTGPLADVKAVARSLALTEAGALHIGGDHEQDRTPKIIPTPSNDPDLDRPGHVLVEAYVRPERVLADFEDRSTVRGQALARLPSQARRLVRGALKAAAAGLHPIELYNADGGPPSLRRFMAALSLLRDLSDMPRMSPTGRAAAHVASMLGDFEILYSRACRLDGSRMPVVHNGEEQPDAPARRMPM